MSHSPTEHWQQYYPTYNFGERDIVLAEYEHSAKHSETEERLFTVATNVTLLAGTAIGWVALGRWQDLKAGLTGTLSSRFLASSLLIVLIVLSWLTLRHFAERQKSIQFAKRKMVVLRTMLGLDYGRLQLVLPSWRLEGATQPFAIRLFTGWLSYAAYPFWIVGTLSAMLLLGLATEIYREWIPHIENLAPAGAGGSMLVVVLWLAILGFTYRSALYDTHERASLSLAILVSRFLRVRVLDSTEYAIYRARLAVYELSRLNIDPQALHQPLIFIEDRDFANHRGISIRGIGRAVWKLAWGRRREGGSTLTQQLVRTLFIIDLTKIWRRKVVEILLALWFERVSNKIDIFHMYVASVRFAPGVFGLASAQQYFFREQVGKLSRAQAFFLAERIGNLGMRIICRRVDHLLKDAHQARVLTLDDAKEVIELYQNEITERRFIPDDSESFRRLVDRWTVAQGRSGSELP